MASAAARALSFVGDMDMDSVDEVMDLAPPPTFLAPSNPRGVPLTPVAPLVTIPSSAASSGPGVVSAAASSRVVAERYGGNLLFQPEVAVATVLLITLVFIAAAAMPSTPRFRSLVRHGGFILLHISDYATNVLVIVIVWMTGLTWYLWFLVPAHLCIGLFCIYTAADSLDWQSWGCVQPINFFFLVVVLGLMQGVQVKLALDGYVQQERARVTGLDLEAPPAPTMMPARFHCKAMDGILESPIFAFVALDLLLRPSIRGKSAETALPDWAPASLYVGSFLGFVTIGLALMEMDHRTSMAVQRLLNDSFLKRVRHLAFRASEVALRLLTVLAFLSFLKANTFSPWTGPIIFGVDYLFGVLLLMCMGGHEPFYNASVVLGVPLFMVNVMQFVDAPGMSLQARRITNLIVPFRLIETMVVVALCIGGTRTVEVTLSDGTTQQETTQFIGEHKEWLFFLAASATIYVVMYFTYAYWVKPGADLHCAVAHGDYEGLEDLLRSSDLVLDINRYGPDGRTPLHLAAVRGQVDCMRLLVEERANVSARTGNQLRNTALHLAAMSPKPEAIRFLVQTCRSGGTDHLLNATNAEGDTAVHIAAKRQNVAALKELLMEPQANFKMKNNAGRTPAECGPSEKFGFDRNSRESVIAELFRLANAGEFRKAMMMNHSTLSLTAAAESAQGFELAEVREIPSMASAASMESPSRCHASMSSSSMDSPSRKGRGGIDGPPGPLPSMSTTPSRGELLSPLALRNEFSSQHTVPLVQLNPQDERRFLRDVAGAPGSTPSTPTSRISRDRLDRNVNISNCGISSFILSAGLGAVSHAFLGTIAEDEETKQDGSCSDEPHPSIDDFSELKAIGEGAFGKVVLVRHKKNGEIFAMKLMDKAKFKAQKITSKAISEQYILKTTRHPFIVALHYAFQGSTFWALVMDFCPNGDLQNLLVEYGKPGLQYPDIARYCGEVMLGIEHLHSIRVIFRDLKLENVVIDAEYRCRLTDFGLAKKLQSDADAKTMCGSYGYAAPEIMLNTGRYTYSVDLYSFGVMYYMMLSGGDVSPKNPKQRLPPMRHASLKRRIREAEKDANVHWSKPEVGAMELLLALTSEDPGQRTTAAQVKKHRFFAQHLPKVGAGLKCVDELLTNAGPYTLPGGDTRTFEIPKGPERSKTPDVPRGRH